MSIKCIIIDDEPLAIQIIERHLAEIQDIVLVATFQNPLDAFELLKTTTIDLIFLDIQMPLITGIEFVKSMEHPPKIIFTTAYRNYAVESYELNVIDYLVKPITFSRLFKAINKFKNLTNIPLSAAPIKKPKVINDHIYVNSNKKFIKIAFDEILYVESIKDYIRIHTTQKNIITKDKISNFETKLPYHFKRIHRSFIVNTSQLSAFTARDVEIDDKEIPIGESYKKAVLAFLKR